MNKLLLNKFFIGWFGLLFFMGCGPAEDQSANENIVMFTPLSSDSTGLSFNQKGKYLMQGDASGLYSNISAVAVGDLNNDGLPDLVFSGGHENTRIFMNDGDLHFTDATQKSGVVDFGKKYFDTEGINLVDINGDGWLDIYILKSGLTGNFQTGEFTQDGANMLFINQQNGSFKEQAKEYGLDIIGLSHTAQFFDFDGDGDLDLYLAQTPESGASFSFSYYDKKPASAWLSDQFYENVDGQFVNATQKVGLPLQRNIPLSVTIFDVDRDGWLDLYVANDFFGPDFFYKNQAGQKLVESHAQYFSKAPMSAMGSDMGDIDNDGYFDLFVGEMMPVGHYRQKTNLVPFSIEIYNKLNERKWPQFTRNMLQRNFGGQHFKDVGMLSGVHATEWSWSCFFLDANLDGNKDLYVANGILRDMTDMDFVKRNFGEDYTNMADPEYKAKAKNFEAPKVKTSNVMFMNEGNWSFNNVTRDWGLNKPIQSRGGTYADLDGDGDLDIVLNVMDDAPMIYRNNVDQKKAYHFVRIRAQGPGQNTFGLGACVEVYVQGRRMMDMLSSQRGFQSVPEPVLTFGLGDQATIDSVVITWPGGQKEKWTELEADVEHTLAYGTGQAKDDNGKKEGDWTISENEELRHEENDFSDFKINRLAIHKKSNMGPGLAAADCNGDGIDEIFLTQGQGTRSVVLSSDEEKSTTWGQSGKEDLGVAVVDLNNDGIQDIYSCSGNEAAGSGADEIWLGSNSLSFTKSTQQIFTNDLKASRGVAVMDFDKDGDQDVFTFGRPDINGSPNGGCLLWVNDEGVFREKNDAFPEAFDAGGLITSALWTDANLDGWPDLLVVGHWRSCQLLINKKDGFELVEFPQSAGWWNSAVAADVDNDGDMDYIMGNHGLNTLLKASLDHPLSLVYYDFDGNGEEDDVVFMDHGDITAPVVNRDLLTRHMPALNQKYFNFKKYAEASLDQMLEGATRSEVEVRKITELRSGVWINNDLDFDFVPFPNQAQSAPIYGLLSEDFNQDGVLDVMISGNSNSEHFEMGSVDALGVCFLPGAGDGHFTYDDLKSPLTNQGFYRAMIWARMSDGLRILCARNNDKVQVLSREAFNDFEALPGGVWQAEVVLRNGQKRRVEYPLISGYLSQTAPIILKNKEIENILPITQ